MDREKDMLKISTPRPGILQLSLNRPTVLNALNHDLLAKLSEAIDSARDDKTVKAILIMGDGKVFCAGADIRELQDLNSETGLLFAKFGQGIFTALEKLGKPSLAAIQGAAFGGGLELAMAATLRIASKETVLGQPEVKLGVIPGFGGTQRLTRLVGQGRAMAWCLTGCKVSATEALAAGLLNEIVPEENLLERALTLLSDMVRLPAVALRSMMTVISEGHSLSIEDGLELEARYFSLCCGTKDKEEGVNAFIEKRQALFCGE